MKNIKNILQEEINKFILNESVTDIVYHFTTLSTLERIALTDTFYMPTWLKGRADKYDESHKFYLSVTRQRNKEMGYSRTKNVRIELDGEKLNQNYKGKPINYWGSSMGKDSYYSNTSAHGTNGFIPYIQPNTENEDRIFSKSPKIVNFSKYIKRIDVLIEKENEYPLVKSILTANYRRPLYIYDNKKDFNYQTENTINEKIYSNEYTEQSKNYWGAANLSSIGKIVNFILNGKGLKYDNLSKKELGEIIAKLLKRYDLDRYISQTIQYCQKEFYNFNFKYDDITQDIDRLHHASYDMEVYDKVMRMIIDFLNENGFKDLTDVKNNSFKKWAIKNNYYLNDYENLDWHRKIKFLTYKQLNRSVWYIIPEPNKECFWDLFPDAKDYLLSEDFFSTISSYKSKDDISFRKYIQHLTHINISVNKMLEIINKFDFYYDEAKDFIVNGKFAFNEVEYYDVGDKYIFFNDKDKIIVKKMFLNEKYK